MLTSLIMRLLMASCMGLGSYYFLTDRYFASLVLLGTGSNLLALLSGVPGHPLPQSLVLTALVVGLGTVALWNICDR